MSPAVTKTFTLGELAKIALGTEKLTNDHLCVLQSLLLILLQKLNCQNEPVSFRGYEAKRLQKLLKGNDNRTRYNFQFEDVKRWKTRYDLLDKLEIETERINLKMQQHFEKVSERYKKSVHSFDKCDYYSTPTEDLCYFLTVYNMDYFFLLSHYLFNTELLSRVMPVSLESFQSMEAKIEGMQNKLREISKVADRAAVKLKCIPVLVSDIEGLRTSLYYADEVFNESILETQEMLDCKCDRVSLTGFRIHLRSLFAGVKKNLRRVEAKDKLLPSTKPILIRDKYSCLSCGYVQDFPLHTNKETSHLIDLGERCTCGKIAKPHHYSIKEEMKTTEEEFNALAKNPVEKEDTKTSKTSEKNKKMPKQLPSVPRTQKLLSVNLLKKEQEKSQDHSKPKLVRLASTTDTQ